VTDSGPDAKRISVRAALDRWIAAMNAGRGAAPLLDLYAEDAIVMATLNPALNDTKAKIAENFSGLADRQKSPGYKAEVIGTVYTHVFSDAAANTGLYTFSFFDEAGALVLNRYRFSFVYRWHDDRWLIVSHHSSPLPEKNRSPQPKPPLA
jgi:uncharacterized protein (TIGR02246 family)